MLVAKIKRKRLAGKFIEERENLDCERKEVAEMLEKSWESEEEFSACYDMNNNYFGTGFIFIEFIDSLNIEQIMADKFIKDNASFVIDMNLPDETYISVVFELKNPIFDEALHQKILNGLKKLYPMSKQNMTKNKLFILGLYSVYELDGFLDDGVISLLMQEQSKC